MRIYRTRYQDGTLLNLVLVHLWLSHNGFPIDGALVGVGSHNPHCKPMAWDVSYFLQLPLFVSDRCSPFEQQVNWALPNVGLIIWMCVTMRGCFGKSTIWCWDQCPKLWPGGLLMALPSVEEGSILSRSWGESINLAFRHGVDHNLEQLLDLDSKLVCFCSSLHQ